MKEEVYGLLVGEMSPAQFIAFAVWAYLGMFVNMLIELAKRKPSSKSSPNKLSSSYYISDNWKRLLIAFFLIPVALLLFTEMFGGVLNNERAFALGLSSDILAELIKRKGLNK